MIAAALAAYEPVIGRDEGRAEIDQLRREVEDFRATAKDVLSGG